MSGGRSREATGLETGTVSGKPCISVAMTGKQGKPGKQKTGEAVDRPKTY